MKKFWIQVTGLIIVIFSSLYVYFVIDPAGKGGTAGLALAKVKLHIEDSGGVPKVEVDVEVADSVAKRTVGLGGREILEEGTGMIFLFDKEDKHRFWMRGLKFPLDFIWIKGDTIVDILPNVPNPIPGQRDEGLPLLESIVPVDKVLEVGSGYVQRYGITIGDKVRFIE